MSPDDGSSPGWYQWLADKAWAVMVAASLGFLALIRRIYRHDARLGALEQANLTREKAELERAEQLRALDTKIDKHQNDMINAVNAMHREIADERRENNENYRMILSRMIERVPRP